MKITFKSILLGVTILIVIVATILRFNHTISLLAMQLIITASFLLYFMGRRLKPDKRN